MDTPQKQGGKYLSLYLTLTRCASIFWVYREELGALGASPTVWWSTR